MQSHAEYRSLCFTCMYTVSEPQSKYTWASVLCSLQRQGSHTPGPPAPLCTQRSKLGSVGHGLLSVQQSHSSGGAGLQKYQLFNKKRPPSLRRKRDTVGKGRTKRDEAGGMPGLRLVLVGKKVKSWNHLLVGSLSWD